MRERVRTAARSLNSTIRIAQMGTQTGFNVFPFVTVESLLLAALKSRAFRMLQNRSSNTCWLRLSVVMSASELG
ncbi:hypothetical protein KOR42_02580 [Thalassoglobus neptunius]|uniref:Uncharacterized protein n=1 Tax=Thalassoglobus neptunius TaxID=1938619 RepID=A0A5C5X3U9_9PLAN|nr:hypothetical protein KOR42_02580 [Thalassoglobus neptunius]